MTARIGRPPNSPEDLWKRVQVGEPGECWPWQGYVPLNGYGQISIERRGILVHRLAYQLATGDDPGDLFVCHSCDNKRCCNPAHLFLGTNGDNQRDASAKGRLQHGSRHHAAKLTEEAVREIRRRRAAGEGRNALAREFGIGGAQLGAIVNFPEKNWAHA